MTNLVLLSYGSQKEYRRAVVAILSFFSYYETAASQPEVRVILYTDSSTYFEVYLTGLPITYVILTPEQQTTMMGSVGYRHRIKAVVVGDTLKQYPQANLLFFDSDTFFTRHPAPLLASIQLGVSVMHTVEFTFQEAAHVALPAGKTVSDFIEVLEKQPFNLSWGAVRFSGEQPCWNSGVLGLAPTVAAYLPDVYYLIDHLYAQSHWHIVEQIVFSLVLQAHDTIKPALNYVYHYWEGDKKIAADALLEPLLGTAFATAPLAQRLATVRQLVQQLPTDIDAYLTQHTEIGLKQAAITAFNADQYWPAYRAVIAYLLRKPTDGKFVKDVLYHTRRRLVR